MCGEYLTDEELVAQWQQGSDQAFVVLDARYSSGWHAIARSILGDTHRAEDGVQDARMDMHKARLTVVSCFRYWSNRVVGNRAIQILRAANVRQRNPGRPILDLDDCGGGTECRAPGVLTRLLRDELSAALRECVSHLPEHLRSVLVLRFVSAMSGVEIGTALAIPPQRVSQRTTDALQWLRKCLNSKDHHDIND
jgi:RNA polymerase sigma factor (sigma-70 family)